MSSTTTILGKRQRSHFVLQVSAVSDLSHVPKSLPIIINGTLVTSGTKKRYQCTHPDCPKAYTKPSRLKEHERSHTGQVRAFLQPIRLLNRSSARSVATTATNRFSARATCTHTPGATFLTRIDLFLVQNRTVKRDFGPPSTSMLTPNGIMARNPSLYAQLPLFLRESSTACYYSARKKTATNHLRSTTNCELIALRYTPYLERNHTNVNTTHVPNRFLPVSIFAPMPRCTTVIRHVSFVVASNSCTRKTLYLRKPRVSSGKQFDLFPHLDGSSAT